MPPNSLGQHHLDSLIQRYTDYLYHENNTFLRRYPVIKVKTCTKKFGSPNAATGCHFTGPIALRHILSDVLPNYLLSCFHDITEKMPCQGIFRKLFSRKSIQSSRLCTNLSYVYSRVLITKKQSIDCPVFLKKLLIRETALYLSQFFINCRCSFFTCAHSKNNRCCTCNGISSGINMSLCSLSPFVCNYASVTVSIKTFSC